MTSLCDTRVAIVTGAGRGIGREHALLLAREGAAVVVNDIGTSMAGDGHDPGPAQAVVEEITAAGGHAVANTEDVASFDGARRLVEHAVETFGRLDVLVNNAGIIRDRMLVNMSEEEWIAVLRVHLSGTFGPSRHAAAYWRDRAKAGEPSEARIINTSSPSGLYGNVGQTNYGAAKAGIAAFTVIAAMELARYGVTVNAVAPSAHTRMTEAFVTGDETEQERSERSPRNIAPIVCWLASEASAGVTGRVFDVSGRTLSVCDGWHRGPSISHPDADPSALGPRVLELLASARPNAGMDGVAPGQVELYGV